jgi:hypothetical protein
MEFMPGELPAEWDDEIDFIAGDDISEVMLSHGDDTPNPVIVEGNVQRAEVEDETKPNL